MRIIAKSNLVEYWAIHPETKKPLTAWVKFTSDATWATVLDIIKNLNTAKVISNDRVRFKICGNHYRLIVAFKFSANIAFIKFIGTHKEYDNIDAATISQF